MSLFIKQKAIYMLMLVAFAIFCYMDYRYLDISYLAITSGDEFMQYHSLQKMLGGIIHLNIEDLFRFDSYVYGFVWHLLNMLVVAPFHFTNNIEMAIYMPRVLNAVFSTLCLLVIFKIARLYLGYFYSYIIVLLAALMPGFYQNGYIFKPDVFQALLILVSVYYLLKDNFAFKKNFYLGVIFFALSLGIAKFQAIMFMPLIYLYIGYVFLRKPSKESMLFVIKYVALSTLFIFAVFILTNPYLLHPRGFGAWLSMFTLNMNSNVTNHGSYVDVSFLDRVNMIDFYYFTYIVFATLIIYCIYYLAKFFKSTKFDVFMPVIGSMLISLIYLFLFVNKTWANYYSSTIFLCVVAFVPLFLHFNYKTLAIFVILAQMGGGSKQ